MTEEARYEAWRTYLRDCPFKRAELDARLEKVFGFGSIASPKPRYSYTAGLGILICFLQGPDGFDVALSFGRYGPNGRVAYLARVETRDRDGDTWDGEAIHQKPIIAIAHAILAMYQPDEDDGWLKATVTSA